MQTSFFLRKITILGIFIFAQVAHTQTLPEVRDVDLQPLKAQVQRLVQAKDYLGEPFSSEVKKQLNQALGQADASEAVADVQRILDAQCLVEVHINPESRVKVNAGPAKRELVEQGWRNFLVKVRNQAGVTAELRASSPNAGPHAGSTQNQIVDRWLGLAVHNAQPLTKTLSGLALEYRIVQLYSRDAGKRDAKLSFDVGQGTQDLGFRNEVSLLFDCQPAHSLRLKVLDENGKPTTAGFEIRDRFGRVYPSQAKRLAPDFHFHPQIYRADDEHVKLPSGTYTVRFYRGPESVPQSRTITVADADTTETFKVQRWIDPALMEATTISRMQAGNHHWSHHDFHTAMVTQDPLDLGYFDDVRRESPCAFAQHLRLIASVAQETINRFVSANIFLNDPSSNDFSSGGELNFPVRERRLLSFSSNPERPKSRI